MCSLRLMPGDFVYMRVGSKTHRTQRKNAEFAERNLRLGIKDENLIGYRNGYLFITAFEGIK
jgi:hypothetical protein